MSSSRSVSSRTAALALALTLGALPLASAEAAQRDRRVPESRQTSMSRIILQGIVAPLFPVLEKMGMGSHPGNGPGNGSEPREGSGVCPNGKPGPQGNPNRGNGN